MQNLPLSSDLIMPLLSWPRIALKTDVLLFLLPSHHVPQANRMWRGYLEPWCSWRRKQAPQSDFPSLSFRRTLHSLSKWGKHCQLPSHDTRECLFFFFFFFGFLGAALYSRSFPCTASQAHFHTHFHHLLQLISKVVVINDTILV